MHVFRWSASASGKIRELEGKPVLEVLLYENTRSGKKFLPGASVQPGELIPSEFLQELNQAMSGMVRSRCICAFCSS